MSEKKSKGLAALAAAAVGAAVGAAAVVFSDKTKRQKAKKELGKLLEEGEGVVDKINKELRTVKNSYTKKVEKKSSKKRKP